MIGSLGWQELLIILVILALLFGASRVASLGGALGKGIREFRKKSSKRSILLQTLASIQPRTDPRKFGVKNAEMVVGIFT